MFPHPQAETNTVTVAQLCPALLTQCRPKRSLDRKDPNLLWPKIDNKNISISRHFYILWEEQKYSSLRS